MKMLFALLAALALYQHWDQVQRWINPPPPAASHGEVVLYATSWCGYCVKTRELFAREGVVYREVDIERDPAGRAQHKALGGRGVPVVDARGQIIYGYNERALRAIATNR